MTGNILILDSVATNRIVLKVKLVAAQYNVRTVSTCEEARETIAERTPDLVLINLSDPTEDSHAFCRELRNRRDFGDVAIVAIGLADTNRARFAALDAGADDVLPRPMSDSLMLARIRGLLRRRSASMEWCMRGETARALGFEEDAMPRITPPAIQFVPASEKQLTPVGKTLGECALSSLSIHTRQSVLSASENEKQPDLYVLETGHEDEDGICRLISDLHARQLSRTAEILVIAPTAHSNLAARLLDLGAGDIAFEDITAPELKIRIDNLIRQKFKHDHRREKVINGLHAAVTDPLTGLYNRRYAQTHLARIAEQAQQSRQSYAVMVLDIDHFKKINDEFGHAAGDLVLVKLAKCLKANFRAVDLIARIGGEEFLIGMPDTSTSRAKIAAERMRRMVNQESFVMNHNAQKINVTISVGVAVDQINDAQVLPAATMFDLADAALYEAKTTGRDRVAISQRAA